MSTICANQGLAQKTAIKVPLAEGLEKEVGGLAMDLSALHHQLCRIMPISEIPQPETDGPATDGQLHHSLEAWSERLMCSRRVTQNLSDSVRAWADEVVGPENPAGTLGGPG